MADIAIYTAIFGGHDELKAQPECPGVEYVCFTDDASLRSDQWRVEVTPPRYEHPRMAATWFRTHAHVVLSGYRYTIWIDGSMVVKEESFADEVTGYVKRRGLALVRHPRGPELMKELKVSLGMPKYDGQPIREQFDHYFSEGLPVDHGLWLGGLIGRDNHDPLICRMNEMWMDECLRWSYQNQISLVYVLWRLGIRPRAIPITGKQGDNHLFRIVPHRVAL